MAGSWSRRRLVKGQVQLQLQVQVQLQVQAQQVSRDLVTSSSFPSASSSPVPI